MNFLGQPLRRHVEQQLAGTRALEGREHHHVDPRGGVQHLAGAVFARKCHDHFGIHVEPAQQRQRGGDTFVVVGRGDVGPHRRLDACGLPLAPEIGDVPGRRRGGEEDELVAVTQARVLALQVLDPLPHLGVDERDGHRRYVLVVTVTGQPALCRQHHQPLPKRGQVRHHQMRWLTAGPNRVVVEDECRRGVVGVEEVRGPRLVLFPDLGVAQHRAQLRMVDLGQTAQRAAVAFPAAVLRAVLHDRPGVEQNLGVDGVTGADREQPLGLLEPGPPQRVLVARVADDHRNAKCPTGFDRGIVGIGFDDHDLVRVVQVLDERQTLVAQPADHDVALPLSQPPRLIALVEQRDQCGGACGQRDAVRQIPGDVEGQVQVRVRRGVEEEQAQRVEDGVRPAPLPLQHVEIAGSPHRRVVQLRDVGAAVANHPEHEGGDAHRDDDRPPRLLGRRPRRPDLRHRAPHVERT